MIRINNSDKIKNVAHVINEYSPSFSGIVNQECKGELWVDSMEEPRIALAGSFAVGSYAFLGISDRPEDFIYLQEFLEKELFPQLRTRGYDCFEFSVESEGIRDHIMDMFRDRFLETETEYSLRTGKLPTDQPHLSGEYQIKKVDSAFWMHLLKGTYENEDFLKTRLLESWHSFEEFESRSIAYCTLFGNRIVAVMVGTASFKHVIAIDIETEEAHRRKGLAYAMAVEFIADCLQHHYTPQWDCVESNPASYDLARRLGFEKIKENTVYWFKL
jgi:hypothetical protein